MMGNSRRDAMKKLGLGATTGLFGVFGGTSPAEARAQRVKQPYENGLPPLKIKSVKALPRLRRTNLVIVKVEPPNPACTGWAALPLPNGLCRGHGH
jgi:mannonate dehydratase